LEELQKTSKQRQQVQKQPKMKNEANAWFKVPNLNKSNSQNYANQTIFRVLVFLIA